MFTRTPSTGYVVFHDIVETTKTFMRDITVIDSDWYVRKPAIKRLSIHNACYDYRLIELSNGYYDTS